jgi:hypothetical protein
MIDGSRTGVVIGSSERWIIIGSLEQLNDTLIQ